MEFVGDASLKLLIAVLLGGAVGLEREWVGKPAGLRTNILIAVGSTLITLVSVRIADGNGDPGRIAAQIVTGVGFIGAGTIIQARGSVIGLTTAATIWAVAGIGIAVGAGNIYLAIVAAVLIVVCLSAAGRIENWHLRKRQLATFEVETNVLNHVSEILKVLSSGEVTLESSRVRRTRNGLEIVAVCDVNANATNEIVAQLVAREDVISVSVNA